ncbi:MAG: hypothetical protein Q8K60_01355 [Parachlamydiaceae bacterium]|nr:hypothetical protein [Parachlamydiaceae bacterium]
MSALIEFFKSEQFIAFFAATMIFIITIFLVAKQWIGFSMALLFLLFALITGFVINHHEAIKHYFIRPPVSQENSINYDQTEFRTQVKLAVDDLQKELSVEKENIQQVMNQVQEIFGILDAEKNKLENFIEETREHFKQENLNDAINQ